MYSVDIERLAGRLLEDAVIRGLSITTAESCTGGLIAGALTEIPGASVVFERGFVVYSNAAKMAQLGVPAALLQRHGAVSAEVAKAMARGALSAAQSDLAVAVTGIAGPTGGTLNKPVGLVHIAAAGRSGLEVHQEKRYGDLGRSTVRARTVEDALTMLVDAIRMAPCAAA